MDNEVLDTNRSRRDKVKSTTRIYGDKKTARFTDRMNILQHYKHSILKHVHERSLSILASKTAFQGSRSLSTYTTAEHSQVALCFIRRHQSHSTNNVLKKFPPKMDTFLGYPDYLGIVHRNHNSPLKNVMNVRFRL